MFPPPIAHSPARAARLALAGGALALSAVAPLAAAASVPLRPSGPVEIVVYNDDRALVREPRAMALAKGWTEVVLESAPLRVDSASVRLSGTGFRVHRQSLAGDLWSAERVFRRFLGDSIRYRYGGKSYRGLLAGIDGDDLFIQRRDSSEVLVMLKRSQIAEVEFPSRLNLRTRPALTWRVESDRAGDHAALLSYILGGLSWSAEYTAVLDPDERSVEWSGRAVIVNRSGVSFDKARVSLVAGEVHRPGEATGRGEPVEGPAVPAMSPSGSDLFAYHLYPVESPIDLSQLETVEAVLVPATKIPARRTHRYDGARDGSKVRVRVELDGEGSARPARPLPAGRVRVYGAGPGGVQALVGEDRIPHTAAGEPVRIFSGVAFDLVGDRSRLSHTRISRNVTEDVYRIRIRNRGGKAARVTVAESLFGNWEITHKSADFRKRDAESAEFDLEVPPGKESVLDYTVRYTF